ENGSPHARYAIVERTASGWAVEHYLVSYDWNAAAEVAQRHGRPDWAVALRTGRMT
ncbi:MAG TPA: metallophosphoesterase, partial [Pseudoduganella sp.]